MGLRLAPEKSRTVSIDEGFDFLGHTIRRLRKRGTNKHYVYTKPSKKAIQAIKDKVIQAENDGWMRHQLGSFLAAFTDDVRVCSARGEKPGPHDIVFDRQQMETARRLQFRGPPLASDVHLSYDDMQVQVQGSHAELRCRGVPLLTGRMGRVGSSVAVRVDAAVERTDASKAL